MSAFCFALVSGALFAQPVPLPPSTQTPPPAVPSADPPPEDEGADIVVQATRSGRRVSDEPLRVEVIDRDEIEEKILMRPGNIAMMLSETSGLRVQVTAPAIGAANIRVQGLDGRFTQLLADGLPLYGGQASSLGLLQIPPTDLGRVEVIKGAVSALYGASALGGVINLVSRRPATTPVAEVLLNATTRDGQDATAYASAPLGRGFGLSLTGGWHRQSVQDLDGDGWIDMPGYDRTAVRPRLFWEDDAGRRLFVTAGLMDETRRGGTLPGRVAPDGQPFALRQHSRRRDIGLVAGTPLGGTTTLSVRAAATVQDHLHAYGTLTERDRHDTIFGEVAVSGGTDGTTWVAGAAYQRDDYHSRTFLAFDYRYAVPGLFAQVEQRVAPDVTTAASARVDFHNRYGTRLSPRLSLLWKPDRWTLRVSAGRGFYAPTPFVEEIEAVGLSRLEPLGALKPEVAKTASIDIGYARGTWEVNATAFGANLSNATDPLAIAPDRVRLVNLTADTRIRGLEGLLRWRRGEIVATATYVFTDAREADAATGRRGPKSLTPRHTAGIVAMWEREGSHRVGLEVYHTGRQTLDDNPYRATSKPYFEVGLLAEKAVGPTRLFVNAENILNVRQTRFDPILRRIRAPDGRWTVDAWAPTEGFVLNAGIRVTLGGD